MSGNNFHVRRANKEDCHEIFRLIKGLAEYENAPNSVKITPESLQKDGFELDNPPFYCLVIDDPKSEEKNPKLIAYTLYSKSYSSYEGHRIVLGDLFILEEYRGKKLGLKLLSAVCKEALKENVKTIRFNVLKTNPSIAFYKHLNIENITETEGWQYTTMKKDEIIKNANMF